MKIQFKKIEPDVYQVIFDEPLLPGEYAFLDNNYSLMVLKSLKERFSIVCFGID
jgi:hypothetical protein